MTETTTAPADRLTQYETVIGLEVHVQLNTESKLFCPCATRFGDSPNSNTCPVCLGHPGVLPVLNKKAVEYAVMLGLALNGTIAPVCKFDRKHYFYPDLPKAYQISQFDLPICEWGTMTLSNGRTIRITRAHMEEDAGKLVHVGADGLAGSTHSLADLNRAGTPLLEIVSEPDIRTGEEAKEYLSRLRTIVRYLGVCDGNLEEGSMRCDANVSVRKRGSETLGTKTEIKNMNSTKAVQKAIEYEAWRQMEMLENNETIRQESRLWDEASGKTHTMRVKEGSADYRYFPDPDLRPIFLDAATIEAIRSQMPELPEARLKRYTGELGLSDYDAGVLIENKALGDFLDAALKHHHNAKGLANWLMGDITATLNTEKVELGETQLTPESLAGLVKLLDDNTLGSAAAKKLLPQLIKDGGDPKALAEAQGLVQVNDTGALEAAIQKVIDANPAEAEAFRSGKDKLIGFFVGQVMRETKGAANPQVVTDLIRQMLRG